MTTKIMAFGEVMMRLEASGYKKLEQTRLLEYSFTGTGVNVMAALSKYGYQTSLLSKLPETSVGNAALSHIRSLGIASDSIVRGGEQIGIYFLEHGFGVRPTAVTYTNRKESSFCQSSFDDYDLEKSLLDVSLIHFCGISLAVSENTRNLTIKVAEKAQEMGIVVSFDCNYRPKLWNATGVNARSYYERMLTLCDICFMTEKDAIYILGMETAENELTKQIEDLLVKVLEKYQIRTIAGTIREKKRETEQTIQGFIIQNKTITFSRKHTLTILDRIGAGDAFASGILHGKIASLSQEDTIEFATAAGVLAHTTSGDSPVSTGSEVLGLVDQSSADLER